MQWVIPWLTMLAIPLGSRILLGGYTPGFDEYESIFLYLSDFILLALFWLVGWAAARRVMNQNFFWLLMAFLGLAIISGFSASLPGLAFYKSARLLLLISYCFVVAIISQKKFFERFFIAIATFGVIEAILGFLQFLRRESLGLKLFGESALNPLSGATSKIVASGAKILRAYGTFPHPNILAAFLVMALTSLFYFWLRRPSPRVIFSSWKIMWSDLALALPMFAISLGIALTFSRTSWAITGFVTLGILMWGFLSRDYFRQTFRLTLLLVAIAGFLYTGLASFIAPRASLSKAEQSVELRLEYNRLGVSLLKSNPLGIGLGNQVFYAVKTGEYQKLGLTQVWQWQPIHNLYLLLATELGVGGLLLFALLLGDLFIKIKKGATGNLAGITAGAALTSLLLFGLFDHFLWTIWQGQLMLWFAIGLCYGLFSKHQPS